MKAYRTIDEINEVLHADAQTGTKIAQVLILLSGNDDYKYNSLLLTLQHVIYDNINIDHVKRIFGTAAGPNEKVASFFQLLTDGDENKYDMISEILAL